MAGNNDLYKAYSILGSARKLELEDIKEQRRQDAETARKREMNMFFLQALGAPLLRKAGDAIAGGVSALISGPTEKKYKEFFQSEAYMAAKAKERKATREHEADVAINKQSLTYNGTFGQGEDAYWQQMYKDQQRAKMISDNPERKAQIESVFMDKQLDKDARENFHVLKDRHKARLKAGDAFAASGKVSDAFFNERSTGFADKTIDFFKGDTLEKQDKRALENYRKSLQAKNMDAYINFDEAVKSGVNPIEAAEEAEAHLFDKGSAWNEDYTTESTVIKIDKLTGNQTTQTTTYTHNRNSKNADFVVSKTQTESIKFTDDELAKFEREKVRKANQVYNYSSKAKDYFTDSAFEKFKKRAKEEGIDNIYGLKNLEERIKLGELFLEFDQTENYKSEAKRLLRERDTKNALTVSVIDDNTTFKSALKQRRSARETVAAITAAEVGTGEKGAFGTEAAKQAALVEAEKAAKTAEAAYVRELKLVGETVDDIYASTISSKGKPKMNLTADDKTKIQNAKPGDTGTFDNGTDYTVEADGSFTYVNPV